MLATQSEYPEFARLEVAFTAKEKRGAKKRVKTCLTRPVVYEKSYLPKDLLSS
jgi:hypothetical protein